MVLKQVNIFKEMIIKGEIKPLVILMVSAHDSSSMPQ